MISYENDIFPAEEIVPRGKPSSPREEDFWELGPRFHSAEKRGAGQLYPGAGHTPKAISAVSIYQEYSSCTKNLRTGT